MGTGIKHSCLPKNIDKRGLLCNKRGLFSYTGKVIFNGGEGFVADGVLQTAGILYGCFFGYAQGDEHFRENVVAFVDLLGHCDSFCSQVNVVIFVHGDKAAGFEYAHGPTDTGLGVA